MLKEVCNTVEVVKGISFDVYSFKDRAGTCDFERGKSYEGHNINCLSSFFHKDKDFIFLDIGAYIGWYSLVCLNLYKNSFVHSFEMNKVNLELLEKNLASYSNSCIHEVALSGKKEKDVVYYNQKTRPECCSLDSAFIRRTANNFTIEKIDTEVLSSFDIDFNKVSAVKMDIEGKEKEVLKESLHLFKPETFFILEGIKRENVNYYNDVLKHVGGDVYIKE